MTMKSVSVVAFIIASTALAGCSAGPPFDDPFASYAQRTDKVTLTAGNAAAANSAIHTIDPWPRYVRNTRIPGDGRRMAGAVHRYEAVGDQPTASAPTGAPSIGGATTGAQ